MSAIAKAFVAAQKEKDIQLQGVLTNQLLRKKSKGNQNDGKTVIQRLFEKLAFSSTDCWIWTGSTDDLGYGRISAVGENKAHRVSWTLFHGPIPHGMKILHKCDVRCCVNPAHLFSGTQKDNVRDMINKSRNVNPVPQHGESNPMAKLTLNQVDEIRIAVSSGESQKQQSIKYGVSPMTISRIINKETWK